MGLDLSATAAGVVTAPLDWDGKWSRVRSVVVGEKLRRDATDLERARRTENIATRIVAFARAQGATVAFIESYAFAQRSAAHVLAEVGGVVKLELARAGIAIHTANMSAARKLLLGKVPKSDAKGACFAALHAAGARFETLDESDAMVACNFGMAELGGYCLAQYDERRTT
jgi:hypothetical protein